MIKGEQKLLSIQWLALQAAGGMGSIPGWGTKIPQPPKKKKPKKLKEEEMSYLVTKGIQETF